VYFLTPTHRNGCGWNHAAVLPISRTLAFKEVDFTAMSAQSTFTFSGYTLRPAHSSDYELAKTWTEKDPEHNGRIAPLFWIDQRPGRDAYLMEDNGGPLFFFKICAIDFQMVELHIQFSPPEVNDRRRIREALIQGLQWLESVLKASGIREIRFESEYPELVRFSQRHLGFSLVDEHILYRKLMA
jgi:hypothetical protein